MVSLILWVATWRDAPSGVGMGISPLAARGLASGSYQRGAAAAAGGAPEGTAGASAGAAPAAGGATAAEAACAGAAAGAPPPVCTWESESEWPRVRIPAHRRTLMRGSMRKKPAANALTRSTMSSLERATSCSLTPV